MGKGNRNRQERAEDKIANPQKYVEKKKKSASPAFVGPLVFAVVVVLLAAVIVGNALIGAGVFMRARTAMESEDIEVDGAMMTYAVNSAYSNYLNYFYEMYSSILSSTSSSSQNINIYSYLGINPNISLKKQVYDKETGQTWFEYICEMAVAQIEEQLIYAQAAKEAGVTLNDEDKAAIEDTMSQIAQYAKDYGYSVNDYIALNYGKGVREKDVRRILELNQLAAKYAQQINDDLYAASTPEKVEAYFQENNLDFLQADYLAYDLVAELGEGDDAQAKYEQAKADLNAVAQALAATDSEEAFKDYIKNYKADQIREEYTSKYYSDYLAEAVGDTDEEKAAAAQSKLDEKIAEDAAKEVEEILTENYRHEDDSALSDWIFGAEGTLPAAANTTFVAEAVETEKKDKYTVTVYFLVSEAARAEGTTRTFTYLLMEDEIYPLSSAEAALEAFANNEHTAETMLELGKEYKNNSACQTMTEVAKGQTGVEELDAWLYTDDRKAGDYTLISYTYEDKKFHVLVVVDEIAPAEWYIECRDAQVSEEMSDWYDEASKTHAVTVHEAVVNSVKL